MKNRLFKIVAGATAIGAIALGGTALADTQVAVPASPAAVVAPANVTASGDVVTNAPETSVSGVADSDNIQDEVQDENGADDATEVGQPEEAKSSTEADGPNGHADEPGNATADHQFDGEE